ncbi:helix-turn-helix domain-containing protein [Aestuariibius sp. 2305UL40-4]|uniref:helix-turn-helix domain-containing protein n=1 Tax=Aestuariibius violaceus TaxID=3234132 RepID=UPI0034853D95
MQQTASSLAEFYTDPASTYAACPQEHRSGGSMPVKMIRVEQSEFSHTQAPRTDVVVGVVLRSETTLRWDMGDGWTTERELRVGDLHLLPADTEASYECRALHVPLFIGFPAASTAAILDDHRVSDLSSFDALTSAVIFRDETIRRTAMQMWAESARTGGTSDLLMDGLTQVLIARLLDKAGTLRRPQPILPLSPAEITRIDTLVEHRLAERLTVEDLARALDMPRWIFADAFKVTTGDTPHAYVTGKRLDKACELLRLGDMPLAEIAYATGFASQSHMTDTFRRILGTTPGKWRREVRQ